MWHRHILKAQAKANLKGVFLLSGLVVLITLILNFQQYYEIISDFFFTENAQASMADFPNISLVDRYPVLGFSLYNYLYVPFELLVPMIGAGAGIIAILFKMFVGTPAEIGEVRYFLTVSKNSKRVDWRILFSAFKDPNYLNMVKVMLIREIKVFLWFLLLIVPGIIKIYEYHYIPWIIAENPGMDQKTAQRISRDLTSGQKMDMFILDLSMLGWDLLAILTLGLAFPFVVAYRTAVHTELYETLKSHSIGNGDVYDLA
ncbi:MAG TPA: DUF975 family protein [Clostridiaceae bacterium]|nr:DUF975 family protein [Clostridiaceae bacterium]